MRKNINQKKKLGQSLIEYVALTALVAIVSIGAVRTFGGKVQRRLNQISTKFDTQLQVSMKARNGADPDDSDIEYGEKPVSKRAGGLFKLF